MSQEIDQFDQKVLDEGRLLRAESQTLLPLIIQRREAAVKKVIWIFKEGKSEGLLAAAAELTSYDDMKSDIENKIKRAELIERKIHG